VGVGALFRSTQQVLEALGGLEQVRKIVAGLAVQVILQVVECPSQCRYFAQ
jgi:hypothetical protein